MFGSAQLPPLQRPPLGQRLGPGWLERRHQREREPWAGDVEQGSIYHFLRRHLPLFPLIRRTLKCVGLYPRGYRNFLDIRIEQNDLPVARLPEAFEGFRILQVSDLHIDLDPALAPVVVQRLRNVRGAYDLAVFTGDFRDTTDREPVDPVIRAMQEILNAVKGPRFGIPGNHDNVELLEALEGIGLPLLVNESFRIERKGTQLHLIGVDDPSYFHTDDLASARRNVPERSPSLLLAHSPDLYAEAARQGCGTYLCGHTHGGQICLPGGFMLLRHSDVPQALRRGRWSWGEMSGYTSRGTGACRVPARFNCSPEITLHRLCRATWADA